MKKSHVLTFILCLGLLLFAGLLGIRSAHAGNTTDIYENKLVDHLFRGVALSATTPANFYVALFTTSCTDSTKGTEVVGAGYARVAIARSKTAWLSTQGDTDDSAGTNGIISNAAAITFPAPIGSWGTVVAVGIEDAASGGNEISCVNLASPKNVNAGDSAPVFGVGNLTYRIDN